MNVSQAVAYRRSVRVFEKRAIDMEVLRDCLDKARQSPSGGNVQPWHAAVLSGDRLEKLKAAAKANPPGTQKPEYAIYPSGLTDPYRARRSANGEAMYASIGLERENKAGRMMHLGRNYEMFGAPVGLFLHTPQFMGPPQWSDMGMWLQTLMLLLVEAGLDSCAQESWAMLPETVKSIAEIPDDHLFFCGLAIGYAAKDAPLNIFDNPRAPLKETIRFLD